MSQGDVEKVTGLLRCYTSRLENGHTVPSVETLEKYAAAFNVPLYRFFYDGDEPVPLPQAMPGEDLEELAKKPGKKGSEARFFLKLKKLLVNVDERDREVFLTLARKLAAAKK
jgi:transcriptional regulator with XRE-family HTH domain